jgi:hypothetical protein
MRIEHQSDGTLTILRDGQTIAPEDLTPQPEASDWKKVSDTFISRGVVIYSSQWTGGYIPLSSTCGATGDVESSTFTVKNLKIYGSVVQGPMPTACSKLIPPDLYDYNYNSTKY